MTDRMTDERLAELSRCLPGAKRYSGYFNELLWALKAERAKALRGKYRDQLNPTDQAEWQPIETAPMDGTEVEAVSTGSLGVRLYPVASRFLEGKWCAWFGPQLEWGPYDPQPDAWRPKQTPPTPGRCVNGGISRMRARGLPAAVNTGCSQMAGLLKTDTNSATAAVSRSA